MAASGNGSPDDVVFQDEGSFYDPDDQGDPVPPESTPEQPAAAVGATDQDDHRRRRRRRRRRSRRGGGDFQGGPPNQQQQRQQRQQRRGPPDRHNNGQPDFERDGPGGASMGIIEGILELHPKGYGFLRDPKNNYAS